MLTSGMFSLTFALVKNTQGSSNFFWANSLCFIAADDPGKETIANICREFLCNANIKYLKHACCPKNDQRES